MFLFNLRTRDPSSIMKKEHVLDNDFMHTPKNDKEKEGYESYQKSGSIVHMCMCQPTAVEMDKIGLVPHGTW